MSFLSVQYDLSGAIRSEREKSLSLHVAINELIDNSIDAGAKNIRIYEKDDDLYIEDDGSGFDDFEGALLIGKSCKRGTGQVGRYGVGMKLACIKFSSSTTIHSSGQTITVEWDDIIAGESVNQWPISESPKDKGTLIVLHDFNKLRRTQALSVAHIAKTYAMLIRYNKATIEVNGSKVEMPPLPQFVEQIKESVIWRGRKAEVRGGIYKTDDPMRRHWSGYYAYYKGRLIKGGITDAGCGDYVCSNFVFHIYLQDDESTWNLSTHKDDSEDLSEFIEYIFDTYTEALIKKAVADAEIIELKECEKTIEELVNGRRDNNNTSKQGTICPKHTSRKRRTSNNFDATGDYNSNGQGSSRKNRSGIAFKFENQEGCGLGLCTKGKKRVSFAFNLNNSFVAHFQRQAEVIAPLVIAVNELFSTAEERDLFPVDKINDILSRTGYHLDGTEERFSN